MHQDRQFRRCPARLGMRQHYGVRCIAIDGHDDASVAHLVGVVAKAGDLRLRRDDDIGVIVYPREHLDTLTVSKA